ncbi:MAG: hypothetical protein ACUZ8O_14305 [Candidatus Anammoxibacter sp.]
MNPIETSTKNRIVITYWNFTPGVVISISGFGKNRKAKSALIQTNHSLNSDGTKTEIIVNVLGGLTEGITISTKSTLQQGDCYITVDLLSGSTPENSFIIASLIGNYLTENTPLTWPQGKIIKPEEGEGRIILETVTTPSPGQNFLVATPTNRYVEILAISWTLITDANSATRESGLQINPQGGGMFRLPPTASQIESLTRTYIFGNSTNVGISSTLIASPFPTGFVALKGFNIQSNTIGIQAGDQFSGILILSKRKITL